jgi:hypothetical protein
VRLAARCTGPQVKMAGAVLVLGSVVLVGGRAVQQHRRGAGGVQAGGTGSQGGNK